MFGFFLCAGMDVFRSRDVIYAKKDSFVQLPNKIFTATVHLLGFIANGVCTTLAKYYAAQYRTTALLHYISDDTTFLTFHMKNLVFSFADSDQS